MNRRNWGAVVVVMGIVLCLAAPAPAATIAGGAGHSLALTADGRVVAWGSNFYGQSTVPAAAQGGVIAVGAGLGRHSLALKADGSVVAWGENADGQCTVPALPRAGLSPWPPGSATAWP